VGTKPNNCFRHFLWFAKRPIGIEAKTDCLKASLSSMIRLIIGVAMGPGQTAFTLMFNLAYSMAAFLVSPITPCLVAA